MNNFLKGKKFRVFALVILDILAVILSSIAALALRFDILGIPLYYFNGALYSIPIYSMATIGILWLFKLYNRVWTYASTSELAAIVESTLLIEAVIVSYHVFAEIDMPRSYYPLNLFFLTLLILCIRFSKVIIKSAGSAKKKSHITRYVMLVGAGSAASMLLKDFRNSDNTLVVCAIDDNINKKNKYIMGVPIVGTRNDITKCIKTFGVTEIIIAMPSVQPSTLRDIISICQGTGKPVKILPSIAKSLKTSSLVGEIRPVRYEDLLGRDAFDVDQPGINEFIENKVILVTGGGGSIGSELCRQIVKYGPKKLVIFDIYENNAYDVQMELERHYPEISISILIGSVRDYDRLEQVFNKYKPDVVYHAAAHKHVPLMEKSPNEAVKNNCLGTLNAVKLADKYSVKNFILISTDKAVRPTNIMGATKRICEMIVQTYAKKASHTRFAAVRFGNVLGSNGSVIPLFLRQIEEGGPVTVTDKNITRFFMTIPEAVSLVLQASLYAKGGEIFVLDMGKPIRIYELAENLIRMRGYKPNEDIEIKVIGLRPGEKLYEEVLMDEEGLEKTDNNMIYIGKPLKFDDEVFIENLKGLIDESTYNGTKIKELTREICKTYTITDN